MTARPSLITFDVFGTVLDWRRGLVQAAREHGVSLAPDAFERIIDAQAAMERGPFRPYAAILASSLIEVLAMDPASAASIAGNAGRWPLFEDSRSAMRRLMAAAPCVAMSNSDVIHAKQVQEGLGYRLSDWISSEVVRAYKPDPVFWRHASALYGIPYGAAWWHVSAYADYDLETARRLGLTCVFVERPHSRAGSASLRVRGLDELADRVATL
jgi:2-haloacid dehalogenase